MTKRSSGTLSMDAIKEQCALLGDKNFPWKPCSHYPNQNRTPEQKFEDRKTEVEIMLHMAWQEREIKPEPISFTFFNPILHFTIKELKRFCAAPNRKYRPVFLFALTAARERKSFEQWAMKILDDRGYGPARREAKAVWMPMGYTRDWVLDEMDALDDYLRQPSGYPGRPRTTR